MITAHRGRLGDRELGGMGERDADVPEAAAAGPRRHGAAQGNQRAAVWVVGDLDVSPPHPRTKPGAQRLEHGFLRGEPGGQVLGAPAFAGAACQLGRGEQFASGTRVLAKEPCEAVHADQVHPDGYLAAGPLKS